VTVTPPLTNAQRQIALQCIFATSDITSIAPIPSGVPLAQIDPGATVAEVFSFLITALGTSADIGMASVLNNVLTIFNAQLTGAQANVAAIEAQIAAL
jgi:hypothetical protein